MEECLESLDGDAGGAPFLDPNLPAPASPPLDPPRELVLEVVDEDKEPGAESGEEADIDFNNRRGETIY